MLFILPHPAKKLFQKITDVFAASHVGKALGRLPLSDKHLWQQQLRRSQYKQYYLNRVKLWETPVRFLKENFL
jgi:hypothetical protein